jgi:hypothetical protein
VWKVPAILHKLVLQCIYFRYLRQSEMHHMILTQRFCSSYEYWQSYMMDGNYVCKITSRYEQHSYEQHSYEQHGV